MYPMHKPLLPQQRFLSHARNAEMHLRCMKSLAMRKNRAGGLRFLG